MLRRFLHPDMQKIGAFSLWVTAAEEPVNINEEMRV